MEETKPLVSFIIPVYNIPADMLRECLDSIMQLSLRPFEREIIVVDDGSDCPIWADTSGGQKPSDGLRPMIDDIIYIRQKNAGVSVARNTGIRMATGRFIQFVDGDDLLLQAPYEHVLDLLRYNRCDMVLFDFISTLNSQPVTPNPQPSTLDPQPSTLDSQPSTLNPQLSTLNPQLSTLNPQLSTLYDDHGPMAGGDLLRCENIHGSTWGYVFSSSIIGSLRFTPGVSYGEDEEFTPQLLLRAESVMRTTAKAYFYRQRLTSATGQVSKKSLLRRLDDSKNVILRLKTIADRMPAADRVAMQRRTAQLTMDYIYNIMVMTRSSSYLERKITELEQKGLFPLPDRDYTTKYTWFRRMTATKAGRTIMLRTLPLLNREP